MNTEYFKFTRLSTNSKTGPIPTTMSSRSTCPPTCPLKGTGCYADNFPLTLHWNKLDNAGLSLEELAANIRKIPKHSLWRHNVAGDLVPDIFDPTLICKDSLQTLVKANTGRRGFTYTHYPLTAPNVSTLVTANRDGFTINVSTETFEDADYAVSQGLPTVVVVEHDHPKVSKTPAGHKVVVCPAQVRDDVTCATCGLCYLTWRSFIIAFRAHGGQRKMVNNLLTVLNL